jgi:fatty-acyl-CoA synthase
MTATEPNFSLAEIFEAAADTAPESLALIHGRTRRTWRAYEARAARIAGALAAAGLEPGAKAGLYGFNSDAYLEAQFGMLKARVTPVNVNYRYVENELLYLLDNADAEALVFDAQFAPRVRAIRGDLPKLRLLIQVDDGSGLSLDGAQDLESLIQSHAPMPRGGPTGDDIYMLYTGGTTGMPKGVMYRQGDFTRGLLTATLGPEAPATGEALIFAMKALAATGEAPVSLAACPLMHGTGLWLGVFVPHFLAGTAVTFRNEKFDPDHLWSVVERERVSAIAIVGDAFAKPMLAALIAARDAGRPYDLTSLKSIVSSGVMFSSEVKRGLLEFADISISDLMGSTEGGMGASVSSRLDPPGATARFVLNPTTKVFNDRDEEVQPGSEEIGMIANGGMTPIGYYKDPEKSARTFREIAGHRYSFPGDFAQVAADGSLILLGRGGVCINTGGEKVFPEEVEEALKAHDSIWDALVVGVPDPRFGERVTAVVSAAPGRRIDEAELLAFIRQRVAGYKAPRGILQVDVVRRAANGKADYKWAKDLAIKATAS